MRAVLRLSIATIFFVLLASVLPLRAQPASKGVLVFAQGSAVQLWDDEGSIGLGGGGGGGLSVPLSRSWHLRGRVVRSRNERDFGNGVVFDNSSTRYTAEVLWGPADRRLAPYVGGGVGRFAFDHHSEFGPNPQDPARPATPVQRFSSSGNELMWGGIAGLTAVSAGRFRLQPEFSMWLSEGWFVQMEVAVLAGWRW